ncbi:DUF4179 domain-containing protein [Paenibacillus sp. JNUCC31]|uniref:DUF4179 domain-containing protein n=1 Tax=Paenibacillus sp. JNUCC-31 TaxID=2777983 RepID=UPI001781F2CC|nr:DUF4179 domain-containing protein [Paenibacillus sp. JNUCC-31]QOS77272.1 DUF4179 domain-containing protein [Paenibacillus sp. JNUCC-31]
MKPIPNDEDRMWEQHLFREEPDADFTLEVMQKLDGMSMLSAEDGNPFTEKTSKSHWMRRSGITAAAVVILVGGAWFAFDHTAKSTQPAVNAVNQRLPDIPVPEEIRSHYLTDDYKRLKPLGLVINPKIQIVDQGYTLKISDVLVDRSQIIIITEQSNPDGSTIPVVYPEAGRIHVTDEEGNRVASMAVDTRLSGGEYQRFVFQLNDDIPDQIFVRGELSYLKIPDYYNVHTGEMKASNTTVDWSFQFNIDMTKAKSLAVEDTMNNTYTTPEGLKLDMTQFVRTPNGTRLDMNVGLTDQLRAKVEEDWASYMDLIYHIEIPETNEYRIFNGSRPNARQAKFRLRDLSGLMDGGPLKLSETWDPAFVTVDAKNIRFVLDGYTIPVKEENSVVVDLDKRRKDTKFYTFVEFEQLGDQIVLYDFNYRPVEQSFNPPKGSFEGNSSLVLEGNGRFRNAFNGDKWVAIDSEGTEYPVEVMGTPDKPNNNEENVVNDLKLIIRGFYKENGTKFTLKRTVVNREYRDVNWGVDLPSYTSLPWQK